MEIDLANPTAEQLEALKQAVPTLGTKLGVMVLDPAQPLSREQMEKLTIQHKIDGEQQTFTAWDAAQAKSLTTSAARDKREAAELRKKIEELDADDKAFEAFRAAADAGKVPPADVIARVAKKIGVEPKDVLDGLQQTADDGRGKRTDDAPARKITLADLDPELQKKLLSDVQAGFLTEQMGTNAEQALAKHISESLAKHPAIVKARQDAESDPSKKKVLERVEKVAIRAVDKESRGRIAQMQAAGSGDILAEMRDIVDGVVKTLDPDTLLQLAAPQPIIMGPSESGQTPLTILSNEKVKTLPRSDPNYFDNEKKAFVQAMLQKGAGG
jgi:hypothetical protein